jgi:hypothetical protein
MTASINKVRVVQGTSVKSLYPLAPLQVYETIKCSHWVIYSCIYQQVFPDTASSGYFIPCHGLVTWPVPTSSQSWYSCYVLFLKSEIVSPVSFSRRVFTRVPCQFAFIKYTDTHLLAEVISTNSALQNDSNYIAKANKQSDIIELTLTVHRP